MSRSVLSHEICLLGGSERLRLRCASKAQGGGFGCRRILGRRDGVACLSWQEELLNQRSQCPCGFIGKETGVFGALLLGVRYVFRVGACSDASANAAETVRSGRR